jgi:predicted nucleotidyltransferase component of viral defense system
MIPQRYILQWRTEAPWIDDDQVEQDLVISRALVDIFSHPLLRETVAFRGGTALHKLYFRPAARYSEDIDLVQIRAERAGPMMDAIRETLDPWLGKPEWKQTQGRVTLYYRFTSESAAHVPLQLKVEINSREHFAIYGFEDMPFAVASPWFQGDCTIRTYQLDELLATKLRALYQRKQGRDLFDLFHALQDPRVMPERIVPAFLEYVKRGGHKITRAQFEKNMAEKLEDPTFMADISALIAEGFTWDIETAAPVVMSRLIEFIPGEPWKGQKPV